MARARNIKPGFFKNEDLAECSPWARLCFAGLWTLADREGRLEDRAKRVKGELFAFDTIEVEPLLVELERYGFLVRYQIDGASFIQISKFSTHQTPHYSEKKSAIKPPQLQESPPYDGTQTPRTLQEDSKKDGLIKRGSQPPDSLIPDSLNHESGKEHADSPLRDDPPPPHPPPEFSGLNAESLNGKAIVPLATGWELPTDWGNDAVALGFTVKETLYQAERFRQFFVTSGKRRSVKGWRQSWGNWLGKAAERQR